MFLHLIAWCCCVVDLRLSASMNMKEGAFPCACLRLCRSHDFRLAFAIPTPNESLEVKRSSPSLLRPDTVLSTQR